MNTSLKPPSTTRWFVVLAALAIVAPSFLVLNIFRSDEETSLKVLRVGILPDENVDELRARYEPLLNHLSTATGAQTQLIVPHDYLELVELFGRNEIDLAYFGGLTFVRSQVLHSAQPLVVRDVDSRFTSWFLVRNEVTAGDVVDFKGRRFSFGSRLSTSGHLMPRHFMRKEKGIVPEEFFSEVRYSGAHDKTAYLVRDGMVDLGVANREIIISMIEDGRLAENDLRVLWESPPYVDYVWAVHEDMHESVKSEIRNAFLNLDGNRVNDKRVLEQLGAGHFLPVGMERFQRLKNVIEDFGLVESENQ